MKTGINRIQKILLLIIAVLAVGLAALLIGKGYQFIQDKKQEKEWAVRHDEVQTELDSMQQQIQEMAGDTQALQAFLDEKVNPAILVEEQFELLVEESVLVQEPISEMTPQDNNAYEEVISGAIIIEEPQPVPSSAEEVPESVDLPVTYAGEAIVIEEPVVVQPSQPEQEAMTGQDMTVGQDANSQETVNEPEICIEPLTNAAENAIIVDMPEYQEPVTEVETVVEEVVISGNTVPAEIETQMPAGISGNAVVDGEVIPYEPVEVELTLEQRRKIRSSYVETIEVNEEDQSIISNHSFDFSEMKIACLGDSLTEGSNLDDLENYKQYAYPSVLGQILNAKEVYNLGIGGSSYGRYWDQAFVDRYKEIPQDTDIIIIMGGTNDGFAASQAELGSLEEKAPRTFYGDVDELMRGLKMDYPNAKIIFVTPLPNILHDYLRSEREYLLPQQVFADAVKELADQHEIDVIDLYNSNILDTHDTQVISAYMPDGVHGNQEGYRILAQHIAKEIIQIRTQDELQRNEQPQEELSEKSLIINCEIMEGNGVVSGNASIDKIKGFLELPRDGMYPMEGTETVSDNTVTDEIQMPEEPQTFVGEIPAYYEEALTYAEEGAAEGENAE